MFDTGAEFDRQLATLLAKGYPARAGLSVSEFVSHLAPLRDLALGDARIDPPRRGWVPFLLVITGELVGVEQTMALTRLPGSGLPGSVDRLFGPAGVGVFRPLPELDLPLGGYLLVDVERGEQFSNLAPSAAAATVTARGRSPLTVAEGVALITQFPHLLEYNKSFALAGSRAGDRRVPTLSVSKRAPKLSWCWADAPHESLGLASAGERIGSRFDARVLVTV